MYQNDEETQMLDSQQALWKLGVGWRIQGWKSCLTSEYVKSNVVTLGVATSNREIECIPFETADIQMK